MDLNRVREIFVGRSLEVNPFALNFLSFSIVGAVERYGVGMVNDVIPCG